MRPLIIFINKLDTALKTANIYLHQADSLKPNTGRDIMKSLLIIITVLLNILLVACTNDQATPVAQETTVDYGVVYNETIKKIVASDSDFSANMTSEQVSKNNVQVFAELQNTLKASGCYNDKIESAYFNTNSIKLGYKPAEFAAMCMIAK